MKKIDSRFWEHKGVLVFRHYAGGMVGRFVYEVDGIGEADNLKEAKALIDAQAKGKG